MRTHIVDGIEVTTGSGNVFADLGLHDADKLKVKSGLMIEITRAVRRLALTQEEAGRRIGLPQPKVSALLRGSGDLGAIVRDQRSMRAHRSSSSCPG